MISSITYNYDSWGNKTAKNIYSKAYSDSINPYELRSQKNFLYDSLHHLLSVFDSKDSVMYLKEKYSYTNDTLRMIENFDVKKKLTSTEYYNYDSKTNAKMIYRAKNSRDLTEKFFYDSAGDLIKDVDYDVFTSSDVNTISYEYAEGLLISERFHSKYDDDIYYKYYYLMKYK